MLLNFYQGAVTSLFILIKLQKKAVSFRDGLFLMYYMCLLLNNR